MPPPGKPTRSGKHKQRRLTDQRRARSAEQRREELQAKIDAGTYIVADTSKHAPHNSYSPPTHYEDAEFTCIDCGRREIWTAKQQQWWYEVAKGPIYSRAVRCRECRRKKRSQSPGGDPSN